MDFLIEAIQRENDESMRMLRVVRGQCDFWAISFTDHDNIRKTDLMWNSLRFLSTQSANLLVSPGSPPNAMARCGPRALILFSSDFI
jgi:hypothetical protein